MVALDLGHHAIEDSIGMGLAGPESHVLLAEMLELGVDRDRLLEVIGVSDGLEYLCGEWQTYKLFSERDLLQLQLVH